VFVVPETVAANCLVVPTVLEAVVGVTAMATTTGAVAVPVRLTTFEVPVEELLVIVS
jgi:hypothetical protein